MIECLKKDLLSTLLKFYAKLIDSPRNKAPKVNRNTTYRSGFSTPWTNGFW